MINLTVHWQDQWQWWHRIHPSAYAKGDIAELDTGVTDIYRHKTSGRIRLYSDLWMDGHQVSVNGEAAVTLRQRGRFGKLYLGFVEA